jgi:hypothetical protein
MDWSRRRCVVHAILGEHLNREIFATQLETKVLVAYLKNTISSVHKAHCATDYRLLKLGRLPL